MRWSESETRLFVKLYCSHRALWDPSDDGYRSKSVKQEAYQDIVTKFNALTNILLDKSRVSLKVKSLRSTYGQELAKMRKRGGIYKPNMKWFQDWHKCFGANRKQVLSSNEESTTESGDDQMDTKTDSENIWVGEEILEDDNKGQCVSTDDDYILLLKTEPQDEQPETTYKKRKRKIKHHPENEFGDSTIKAKEDEFDIYGKFIASQLRNMDIEHALKVQMQIQSIVSSARIESLNRP